MFIIFVLFFRNSICLSTAGFEKYNAGTFVLLSMMYCHLFHQCFLKEIMYAQLHSSSKGICIASILTFISLYLTSLTLHKNSEVGKTGKPKSRKRGWGEAEFLYLYYSTIICNGGQRGWGLGVACCASSSLPVARPLHLLAATQVPTSQLPSSSGIGSPRRETSCFQPNGRLQQNERSHSWCVIHSRYHFHFRLSLKRWFSPL